MKSLVANKRDGLVKFALRVPRAVGKRFRKAKFILKYKSAQRMPLNDSLIVIESEGDLSDNAYALYDYLRDKGYLDRYQVVWAVDDVLRAKQLVSEAPGQWTNTFFVSKALDAYDHNLAFALATCKWFIYDHSNLMANLTKRPNQSVVFLSHGCGYKGPKGLGSHDITSYDLMTVTGPLAAICVSNWQNRSPEFAVCTGYPRNDYLLRSDPRVDSVIADWLDCSKFKKTILWMPTFRQSDNSGISEDYIRNETGLPLFNSRIDLSRLSDYLVRNNVLLLFKLHHLQSELPVFNENFKNIVIIRDEQLRDRGIQLYQFVRYSDALISDYSSISVDFMLLDRPMIYTLDDYDEYSRSRGLFPPNAIDYMPGYHVYSIDQLENAIDEILAGEDIYRSDREAIISEYHTYRDANSSKRVLDVCGIR